MNTCANLWSAHDAPKCPKLKEMTEVEEREFAYNWRAAFHASQSEFGLGLIQEVEHAQDEKG